MTHSPATTGLTLRAVLFDMDGTLLDSEKVWDVALADLAAWLGGSLSVETRRRMVGSSINPSIAMLHEDLGVDADARLSAEFLTTRTAELFITDLMWKPGAEELLRAVRLGGVAAALVTSTERGLTEIALETLGRENFAATVCGDEVTRTKPDPEPYLRAAALLGVDPARCVVIEDSPLGVTAGEASGAAVVAVPSEVALTPAASTTLLDSLVGVTVADLDALVRR